MNALEKQIAAVSQSLGSKVTGSDFGKVGGTF